MSSNYLGQRVVIATGSTLMCHLHYIWYCIFIILFISFIYEQDFSALHLMIYHIIMFESVLGLWIQGIIAS
jgi:hypothetical protein